MEIKVRKSDYFEGGAMVKLGDGDPFLHLTARDAFTLFCKLGRNVNSKAARRARRS